MSRTIGSMNRKRGFDVAKCVIKIKGILSTIIDDNMLQFRVSALEQPELVDFSVKNTQYGYQDYHHWILDRVEGHYDKSLWSLLHWILYQEKYYHRILTETQLQECETLLREDPAALYLPTIDDEIDDERLTVIDDIMFAGVLFVGQKIINEDFHVSKEMKNLVCEFDNA